MGRKSSGTAVAPVGKVFKVSTARAGCKHLSSHESHHSACPPRPPVSHGDLSCCCCPAPPRHALGSPWASAFPTTTTAAPAVCVRAVTVVFPSTRRVRGHRARSAHGTTTACTDTTRHTNHGVHPSTRLQAVFLGSCPVDDGFGPEKIHAAAETINSLDEVRAPSSSCKCPRSAEM